MNEKNNILFIDIDGVLNSTRSLWKKYAEHFGVHWEEDDFDIDKWYGKGYPEHMNPDLWDRIDEAEVQKKEELGYPKVNMYDWPPDEHAIKNINTIVKENNAKGVICSSWRKFRSLDELKDIFKKWGVEVDLIGITPTIMRDNNSRGLEILNWIMDNHSEISGICIIDDEAEYDINNVLGKWAVQGISTYKHGLREEHIPMAKECFKTPINPLYDFDKWVSRDKLDKEREKYKGDF